MAKKTYQHSEGPDGRVTVSEVSKPTRAQRKSLTLMPWTAGPQTKTQKITRALWG